jgi:pimeloyl-ACP methyl ester carboxylesterase
LRYSEGRCQRDGVALDSMQTGFVILGSSQLSYSVWGTGKKPLLCFHGYGESASSFAFLEDRLGSEFTILAPDLPFHGATQWNDGLYFDPSLLPVLIENILGNLSDAAALPSHTIAAPHTILAPHGSPRPNAITPLNTDRWWVLGYSMGGRVAVSLLGLKPEKIAKMVLLAPDGLKMNRWYFLATQTGLGNRVFRHIMRRPRNLLGLLKMAGKAKWINPAVHKFMLRNIEDPQVREDLYKRWTVMRGFKPNTTFIKTIIRKHRVPVNLVYGRYDRIIRHEDGDHFRQGIAPWCKLLILDTGHALLQTKFLDTIVKLLND